MYTLGRAHRRAPTLRVTLSTRPFNPAGPSATLALAALALLLTACADETAVAPGTAILPHTERVSLIDHALWEPTRADLDPFAAERPPAVDCPSVSCEETPCSVFAAERPPAVDCPPAARRLEDNALEIDTEACNYLALSQPTLATIALGEPITLVGRNNTLFAEEPAEAHLALVVGDTTVWEQTFPVPGPDAVWTPVIESPIEAEAGTPIQFHLHNHGSNNWVLLLVAVGG